MVLRNKHFCAPEQVPVLIQAARHQHPAIRQNSGSMFVALSDQPGGGRPTARGRIKDLGPWNNLSIPTSGYQNASIREQSSSMPRPSVAHSADETPRTGRWIINLSCVGPSVGTVITTCY